MALSERIETRDMGFLTSHDLGALTRKDGSVVEEKEAVDPIALSSEQVRNKLGDLANLIKDKDLDPSTIGFLHSFGDGEHTYSAYLTTEDIPGVPMTVDILASFSDDLQPSEPPSRLTFGEYQIPEYHVYLDTTQFSLKERLMHPTAKGITPIPREVNLAVLNQTAAALDSQINSLQHQTQATKAA